MENAREILTGIIERVSRQVIKGYQAKFGVNYDSITEDHIKFKYVCPLDKVNIIKRSTDKLIRELCRYLNKFVYTDDSGIYKFIINRLVLEQTSNGIQLILPYTNVIKNNYLNYVPKQLLLFKQQVKFKLCPFIIPLMVL